MQKRCHPSMAARGSGRAGHRAHPLCRLCLRHDNALSRGGRFAALSGRGTHHPDRQRRAPFEAKRLFILVLVSGGCDLLVATQAQRWSKRDLHNHM